MSCWKGLRYISLNMVVTRGCLLSLRSSGNPNRCCGWMPREKKTFISSLPTPRTSLHVSMSSHVRDRRTEIEFVEEAEEAYEASVLDNDDVVEMTVVSMLSSLSSDDGCSITSSISGIPMTPSRFRSLRQMLFGEGQASVVMGQEMVVPPGNRCISSFPTE